ncbi:matrix metalloproteinase-16-like protein [Dinothrombium tinctorium]|uniref:Matrix metalloproteinase-16-like protein n=1 Tax=Dinothrombium tinctorium TaxID=1965070 RepID=A0A3S3NXV6_9ACAR|nr:matrix metalloproteinase-16-like protein [Dinothrombium tinctorium]RWS08113.1 matrix metalloproteinase-16-like protein [Dinothrombium tinctorium]RWS09514.1 matrix metalloproteinase-16-like protein [Dinothrombium tinctorium]
MNAARCANRDEGEPTEEELMALGGHHQAHPPSMHRRKRAVLQGSKWSVIDLSWKISRYPSDLPPSGVLKDISKAFRLWSKVTPLNFHFKPRLKASEINIDIRFDSGCHGDEECHDFDGEVKSNNQFGNTLAHAFYPQWGGDIHFDEDEEWNVNTTIGCSVFIVAAHEIGHSLGLNHSETASAMMQPIYPPYRPNHNLHEDDIEGVQALYGSRRREEDRDEEIIKNATDLCIEPSIDGIGIIGNEITFFKKKFYYKIVENGIGIKKGYPKLITRDFEGVEGPVDAVLTANRDRTYIFQGKYYWKFFGTEGDNYKRKISDNFEGIPSNIDAAFQMESKGHHSTYIFKGNDVWKFSDPDYFPRGIKPKKIDQIFSGLPSDGIDAIFQARTKSIYAFKKSKYWRLNSETLKV